MTELEDKSILSKDNLLSCNITALKLCVLVGKVIFSFTSVTDGCKEVNFMVCPINMTFSLQFIFVHLINYYKELEKSHEIHLFANISQSC